MSHYSYRRDAAGEIVIKPKQEWYSIKQITNMLSISAQTVGRLIKKKELHALRIGWRWRVPYEALQAFLVRSNERR